MSLCIPVWLMYAEQGLVVRWVPGALVSIAG